MQVTQQPFLRCAEVVDHGSDVEPRAPFSGADTSTCAVSSLIDLAFFGNFGNDSNRTLHLGHRQT
jgi:hypothetical protein